MRVLIALEVDPADVYKAVQEEMKKCGVEFTPDLLDRLSVEVLAGYLWIHKATPATVAPILARLFIQMKSS